MKTTTLAFHKPYEVLCQFTDTSGRATLKDYISVQGVYAAGRLDYRSEGLLILTNDGELNHALTDPAFEHPRTYLVQLEGVITAESQERLLNEFLLPDQHSLPLQIEVISDPGLAARPVPVRNYHPTCWLKIVLREGKKHEVRRLTAAAGFPTLRLVRYAIGNLTIKRLGPGTWRKLNLADIRQLRSNSS